MSVAAALLLGLMRFAPCGCAQACEVLPPRQYALERVIFQLFGASWCS